MKLPKNILEKFEKYCEENNISGKEKGAKLAMLESIYKKSRYEAGEAIGIVAAQSLSEPATQMSTSPYEKLILRKNGVINIVEIGKFTDIIVERLGENVDGWDVYDISSEEIYVPSITNEEKIEWHRVKACSRHNAPEKMLRIITSSGRQIIATDSHSFVTRKNNKIVPVAGSALKPGDRIPVMKYLPENCTHSIEIKDNVSNVLLKEKLLYSTKQSKPVPNRIELDFNFGWFIGAYLSEGSCNGSQIGISNINENFISHARQFAERLGLDFKDRSYAGVFGPGRTLTINSTILSQFIIATCGRGSKNKHVPYFAYSANEKFVSGLLRGYFDGDGNVHAGRKLIRVSSNSKELLDGMCLMLARFGIFAYKVMTKNQNGLLIPYKYAPVFLEKIGSDIEKKRKGLEKMAAMAEDFWNLKSQDFTDMIAGFDDVLFRLAKKLRYPTRYINNFTNRQKIGRTALYRYIKNFEALAEEKGINISKDLAVLKRMFNSDVIWDEIVGLEYVKPDYKYVYDFTVEGSETFTTFDGIVTHNTMRSYTLATQSDRLSKVTQGLPRLIEIFDARKTFEKNMVIYLREEYNNKDKAKEIANKIKETKIADITVSDSLDLIDTKIEIEFEKFDGDELKKIIIKHMKDIEVSAKGNKLVIKPGNVDIKTLKKVKDKILDIHIDGIPNIKQVVIVKEKDDWVIQTSGTNLRKVLEVDQVDIERTRTNDVYQVYEVLGVEAARNALVREIKETLDEQGLDVDIRHIMLLADTMTFDGTLKAIGRYGISGEKLSMLARANFEETKKHIVSASFYGEEDKLLGVTENILVGQIAPIGTGLVDLVVDTEKMKKMVDKK
ncbi:MAG: DNA-directed RNA polymerase subunit A'' [Candidatus Aenigmarchaeota archaeon]|nr:DNA-directed RNA polymerase subunit A'' [Candidatus Aenigmarchaeota archaeon]